MATGTHWEWRVFGNIPLSIILWVTDLPKHFGPHDRGSFLTDHYLWTPDGDANVKLRGDSLKFKRLLQRKAGGLELWTEQEKETFGFPLSAHAMTCLCEQLKVRPPLNVDSVGVSDQKFRSSLSAFEPAIRLVPVQKHRIQYRYLLNEEMLIVELTQIYTPVETWSISIEGADLKSATGRTDPVRSNTSQAHIEDLRNTFALPPSIAVGGYLDRLAAWAALV